MRFNLYANVVVTIEANNTRIVTENTHAPVVCSKLLTYNFR